MASEANAWAFHHSSSGVMVGSDMGHVKNLPQIGCLLYFKNVDFFLRVNFLMRALLSREAQSTSE